MLYSNVIVGKKVKMRNGKVGRVMQKHDPSGNIFICFDLGRNGKKVDVDGWVEPQYIKCHVKG